MTKIDTSTWKEFNLKKDLGFLISHGSRIKKTDRAEGDIVFITAGKENQGVVGKIGNKIEIWNKPITVDMFGNAFFQPYENCCGDDNIYAFINDNIMITEIRDVKYLTDMISLLSREDVKKKIHAYF